MKVLHINRNYLTSALHQTMAEHLDAQGVENMFFAPTEDSDKKIIKPNKNVIVSECFNKFDRFIYEVKQKKIQQAVEDECDVGSFDCIHAYTLFTDGNCAMKLSDKYGIPYVVAVRNTDVNDFFKKLFFLRERGIKIMEKASAIFFLSNQYKEQVFRLYVPEEMKLDFQKKTFVIPNGIDDFWLNNAVNHIADIHIKRIREKKINLIYAGRIDKNKNIPMILKAIGLLKKEDWQINFTVVGRVDDWTEFDRIKRASFVYYVPACEKEKLISLYRKNDIFVMPSFTETFGLVYAEAMSQGLPVIYTKGQGFDGQFPEGKVGYSVDCRNPDELAARIIDICNNYEKISNHSSKNVQNFRWEKICQQYVEVYHSILKKV